MASVLLTTVVTELVKKKIDNQEYGVSIINLPDFDYQVFSKKIISDKPIGIFFLGYSDAEIERLKKSLPARGKVSYAYSIESAEESRNSGDESVFRIFVVKKTEIEKLSSLMWFPRITLSEVYHESCNFAIHNLEKSNKVIVSLLRALRKKEIQNILGFERVLEYLEIILNTEPGDLPQAVKDNYYRLGICKDSSIVSSAPTIDDIAASIQNNHAIVERIGNLEQTERQSITNYYANNPKNKDLPRLILRYYKTKDASLLKDMEFSEVEACLKAVKKKLSNPVKKQKKETLSATSMAADLVFTDDFEQIESVLTELEDKVDNRANPSKSERVVLEVDDKVLQIKVEPATERVAEDLISDIEYGGIIRADVPSPADAINDIDKYLFAPFKEEYLNDVWNDLASIKGMIDDEETISSCLKEFLECRKSLVPYKKRLQDAPMLSVISHLDVFSKYLSLYEKLLLSINEDYTKISSRAASNAKKIVGIIMSLDNIYIIGEHDMHSMPTPLNPLYLWKYIKLAEEICFSRGISESESNALSEDDKAFVVRKAEDIPDPISVVLLPANISRTPNMFLPIAGRLGTMPIYSTRKQINQSESGIDSLRKSIIRYLCLYPHAGMMLKLSIIDPPSVETVVSMLKALDKDKEFNIVGIDLSVYRTKESSSDWVSIKEESLNDGLLGRYKGKRSLQFRFKIVDKAKTYDSILGKIDEDQHLMVVFDPSEVKVTSSRNEKNVRIHPLCIPKVYDYNPLDQTVEIRPANESDILSTYTAIVERLNENRSSFCHTSAYFRTPLSHDTYDLMLNKTDWLIILDQSLKSWDISLKAASEKLFYKENDYRSMGIYSNNVEKFERGYSDIINGLGNLIPQSEGVKRIIDAVRGTNEDGLLSLVSHSSNRIFDPNHGKGSVGLAVSSIIYTDLHSNSLLVGMDTQLAKEWLSNREDGILPDLIGIDLSQGEHPVVDIIEVKTYDNSINSFIINGDTISGHAIDQVSTLENLLYEMFSPTERITTVSRRELLREQVFEALFQSSMEPKAKLEVCDFLNQLFAGKLKPIIKRNIAFVDFEHEASSMNSYSGAEEHLGKTYCLATIGSALIQSIVGGKSVTEDSFKQIDQPNAVSAETPIADSDQKTEFVEPSVIKPMDNSERVNNHDDKPQDDSSEEVRAHYRRIEGYCTMLNKVLRDYGIQAHPVIPENVLEAARFVRFKVELKSGETIKTIERYKDDIGRQLEAGGDLLVDNVKGTKYVSIDVPFAGSGSPLPLLDYLSILDGSKGFLDFIAGQTPDGVMKVIDLARAPHLLVSGTTGSGKTVFLFSLLVSLMYQYKSDEIEFLIIDPKQTDFIFFEDLPNLYSGHVVIDPETAITTLQIIDKEEKEKRTARLRASRSKDIESYNEKNPTTKMKRLVVVIDEYADLVTSASNISKTTRQEFETTLCRLAQRVRNLGIHLVIATQRPSANIVTGALKANIPFRVSFRLPSHTDSQTILDMPGAEDLLGKGDMLMVTDNDIMRMQGLFISEDELERFIADYY